MYIYHFSNQFKNQGRARFILIFSKYTMIFAAYNYLFARINIYLLKVDNRFLKRLLK